MSDSSSNGLPCGWATTTLGDALRWSSGGTPKSTIASYYEGRIPWVVIGDLTDSLVSSTMSRISDEGLANSSAKWVEPGSVLVAMYGSIGKLGIATIPLTTNQAIAFTDPQPLESKFLFWYLMSIRGDLARLGQGGTQLNISQSILKQVPFIVAPLAEQRRIVAALEEHLSDLDAAVAELERVRANISRYREAVQDEAVGSGNGRWTWTTLGEHLTGIEAGASFKCEERPPDRGETGVVKVSAVTWGTYDDAESKTVRSAERVVERLLIEPGDFLFSRANTIKLVGACVIAERVTRRVMLSDKILRFTFRDLNPRWALLVLRSAPGRAEIERLATGNQESMRNIGQDRIRAIRLPVPSAVEQQTLVAEVERRLAIADRTAAEIDIQLARAARLRQSILKRAFEGKLVPQDPNDEPASALLGRIRAERATSRPERRSRSREPSARSR